jgi:hypothetical protein
LLQCYWGQKLLRKLLYCPSLWQQPSLGLLTAFGAVNLGKSMFRFMTSRQQSTVCTISQCIKGFSCILPNGSVALQKLSPSLLQTVPFDVCAPFKAGQWLLQRKHISAVSLHPLGYLFPLNSSRDLNEISLLFPKCVGNDLFSSLQILCKKGEKKRYFCLYGFGPIPNCP